MPMPMPIRQLLISVLLIAAFLGSPAHAQQAYFGGNLALMQYDTVSLNHAMDAIGLNGRVGLGDKRGIFRGELRFGVITGKEDVTLVEDFVLLDGNDGSAITLATQGGALEASGTLIGAYALVGMPAESAVRPYAFLGYSLTDWTQTLCARGVCEEVDDDANNISFGFGVDFDLSNDWIINVEYGVYVDKSDAFEGDSLEVDGLSIGVSLPFGY